MAPYGDTTTVTSQYNVETKLPYVITYTSQTATVPRSSNSSFFVPDPEPVVRPDSVKQAPKGLKSMVEGKEAKKQALARFLAHARYR